MNKILTLCIIHQNDKVLLGMKKRGFGVGRWNGFGGKVVSGETIEGAAKRETREESGIEIKNLVEVGIIDFEFKDDPQILEVHIFQSTKFSGVALETEEMKPEWFDKSEIPYDLMWPDDKFWLPILLEGKKFRSKFLFGKNDVILKKELSEVKNV